MAENLGNAYHGYFGVIGDDVNARGAHLRATHAEQGDVHAFLKGGGETRGVVSTACYIARTFGVRSAMPMFEAKRLCPKAVILKPRHSYYSQVARQIRAMMEELTPLVEPLSLDEAYLDLSGTERIHHKSPAKTTKVMTTAAVARHLSGL